MDKQISALTVRCTKSGGASRTALDAMVSSLRMTLPADYLALMAESNGLEGWVGENYLSLWSVENVTRYGVYECAPFLLFIGSNGGGEGYAYDTRLRHMPIVNVPFVGMDEDPRVMGKTILEFLRRLEAAPLF